MRTCLSPDRIRLSLLAAALFVAAPALAQPPAGVAVPPQPTLPSVPNTEIEPPPPARGPYLPVPPDATLVGDVAPSGQATDDRTFRSQWSFDDVVRFYDRDFQRRGTEVLSRRVEPDGITFQVRRANGKVDSVTIRKGRQTVIETRQVL